MANPKRHHVTLTFKDGKRQLLLDGEPVKGVISSAVSLPANDGPTVTIQLRAASFRYESDGPTNLVAEQPVIHEDGIHVNPPRTLDPDSSQFHKDVQDVIDAALDLHSQ